MNFSKIFRRWLPFLTGKCCQQEAVETLLLKFLFIYKKAGKPWPSNEVKCIFLFIYDHTHTALYIKYLQAVYSKLKTQRYNKIINTALMILYISFQYTTPVHVPQLPSSCEESTLAFEQGPSKLPGHPKISLKKEPKISPMLPATPCSQNRRVLYFQTLLLRAKAKQCTGFW